MARKIHKVLIANRGEIACRIARTCHSLGIATVAVYSEPDRLGLHVLSCREAVAIGPGPASESYLVADKLIEAAKATGADAIHPGYGFLSENPAFARKVVEAGLIWIGPPAEAIAAMGIKTEARSRMVKAGVPVVPGSEGPLKDGAAAVAKAKEIGLPVMLKAAGGGGGKGMRIVEVEGDVAAAFERCVSEARSATGNPTVYLERYFPEAHHVEIQVLAGPDGKARALGDRECSVQRRHQKVIEECPSPFITAAVRTRMQDAAVKAAEACGYRSAGTVEFLVDPGQNFYFLEMNCRIQVEHPVTELVYGIDLVEQQLRVAEGLEPEWPVGPRGWAVEARVYAEDPAHGFRPSPGPIQTLREPGGPFVRVDSGVYPGAEISRFYDPMIAKVAAWGPDRASAIRRLRQALDEYVVQGVANTVEFCRAALAAKAFGAGNYTTAFIGRDFVWPRDAGPADREEQDLALVAAALARHRIDQSRAREAPARETRPSPYAMAGRIERMRARDV